MHSFHTKMGVSRVCLWCATMSYVMLWMGCCGYLMCAGVS